MRRISARFSYDSLVAVVSTLVLGVMAFSALLGWMLLQAATSVERAKRDPKYRHRLLLFHVTAYGAGIVFCGVQLVMQQQRSQILCFLLFGLMNVLSLINLARKQKAPPA